MSDENDQTRSFEDKVQDRQDAIEAQFRRISRGSWARIIRMARKPTPQEFKQTSIICGIGLFVLGFIGFVMLVFMDSNQFNESKIRKTSIPLLPDSSINASTKLSG